MESRNRKNKLLIVDDEETIREMLGTMFESLGYETMLAGNGKEALDKMVEQAFDAVIMDLKMPVLDGLQVVEELSEKNKPLIKKIILITGELVSKVTDDAIALHNVSFLRKPFKIPDLEAMVKEKIKISI